MNTGLHIKTHKCYSTPVKQRNTVLFSKRIQSGTAKVDLTPRPSTSPETGRDGSGQIITASNYHSSFHTHLSPAECSRLSSERSAPFVDLVVRQLLHGEVISRVDKVGIIRHVRRLRTPLLGRWRAEPAVRRPVPEQLLRLGV